MTRREFLATPAVAAAGAQPPSRPNIVLIMADDLGFSDIGCYGSEIRTPHLDTLARGGIRFTQFYNTARCCPTRASLLTGLYAHQTGVGHMVDNPKAFPAYTGDLNRSCVTLGEVLRQTGYRTSLSGKWHVTPVTDSKHNWPLQRGFDRFYGVIHGAVHFFDPTNLVRGNEGISADDPRTYYFTDAVTDEAVASIKEAADRKQPFFLYAAYTAPHWPLHARDQDIAKYSGHYASGWDEMRRARYERMVKAGIIDKRWPLTPRDSGVPAWSEATDKTWQQRRMEVYAAQVDRMDAGIGRILSTLKDTGQADNTLVIFLADNGGCAEEARPNWGGLHMRKQTRDGRAVRIGNEPSVMPGPDDTFQSYGLPWANASNTPFRFYKHWVHEGGISTPFIASWPGQIRPGSVCHDPAHLVDVMATLVDVAGAQYPTEHHGERVTPMEGTTLRPAFKGKRLQRSRPVFWEHEGNRAIREGRWKLVSRHGHPWELFDLQADRTEMTDLAARHSDRVAAMAEQFEKWAERVGVQPWNVIVSAPRTPAPIPRH